MKEIDPTEIEVYRAKRTYWKFVILFLIVLAIMFYFFFTIIFLIIKLIR